MATHSASASELKYASGSSWSSGKARQGVYSSTRYEGAIKFPTLSDLAFSNISISKIELQLTFAKSGGSSNKYLYFYQATSNTISGSISAMRGDALGTLYVEDAYNRTATLTFDSETNADLFHAFCDYFASGNQVLILYAPKTRGTYSGGYCYDYLNVTAATALITYAPLQSTATLSASSIQAGSSITINITANNAEHSHKLKVSFGSHSMSATLPTGQDSATFVIPLSWLDAIPASTSGSASIAMETFDADGISLGTSNYGFTVTAPDSVIPTLSGITVSPINDDDTAAGWGIFIQDRSCANLAISDASGVYGSSIKTYSITTDPPVGSSAAASFTTGTLTRSGTVTVTARVTDTRGRYATATTTFTVLPYAAPYIQSVTAYRCNSMGIRDDVSGTYAYFKAVFGCSPLDGYNGINAELTISQVGGSYSTYAFPASGDALILGAGKLLPDASYEVFLLVNDSLRTYTPYVTYIGSAEYVIHVKKGGKAIGIGTIAGEDETVTLGWPLKMAQPLGISEGGTDAVTAKAALSNLGVFFSETLPDTGEDGQICLVPV